MRGGAWRARVCQVAALARGAGARAVCRARAQTHILTRFADVDCAGVARRKTATPIDCRRVFKTKMASIVADQSSAFRHMALHEDDGTSVERLVARLRHKTAREWSDKSFFTTDNTKAAVMRALHAEIAHARQELEMQQLLHQWQRPSLPAATRGQHQQAFLDEMVRRNAAIGLGSGPMPDPGWTTLFIKLENYSDDEPVWRRLKVLDTIPLDILGMYINAAFGWLPVGSLHSGKFTFFNPTDTRQACDFVIEGGIDQRYQRPGPPVVPASRCALMFLRAMLSARPEGACTAPQKGEIPAKTALHAHGKARLVAQFDELLQAYDSGQLGPEYDSDGEGKKRSVAASGAASAAAVAVTAAEITAATNEPPLPPNNDAPSSFLYTYDFGTGWVHRVHVERFREPVDPSELEEMPHGNGEFDFCGKEPVHLLDGSGATPPEDAGGVIGYRKLLEKIEEDPDSDEAKTALEWLRRNEWLGLMPDGKTVNPARFDADTLRGRIRALHPGGHADNTADDDDEEDENDDEAGEYDAEAEEADALARQHQADEDELKDFHLQLTDHLIAQFESDNAFQQRATLELCDGDLKQAKLLKATLATDQERLRLMMGSLASRHIAAAFERMNVAASTDDAGQQETTALAFLTSLGLERHAPAFENEGLFSLEDLLTLDEAGLADLGLSAQECAHLLENAQALRPRSSPG